MQSFLIDTNMATYLPAVAPANYATVYANAGFQESNLMHNINGYVYCNMPAVTMPVGSKTRFYIMGLGARHLFCRVVRLSVSLCSFIYLFCLFGRCYTERREPSVLSVTCWLFLSRGGRADERDNAPRNMSHKQVTEPVEL